jgi:hypothetical protein
MIAARTVSETVSESGGGAMKNCGGLKQIIIDFTEEFATLLALHRTFHVAARRPYQPKSLSKI